MQPPLRWMAIAYGILRLARLNENDLYGNDYPATAWQIQGKTSSGKN
jgi:hypothetical protein